MSTFGCGQLKHRCSNSIRDVATKDSHLWETFRTTMLYSGWPISILQWKHKQKHWDHAHPAGTFDTSFSGFACKTTSSTSLWLFRTRKQKSCRAIGGHIYPGSSWSNQTCFCSRYSSRWFLPFSIFPLYLSMVGWLANIFFWMAYNHSPIAIDKAYGYWHPKLTLHNDQLWCHIYILISTSSVCIGSSLEVVFCGSDRLQMFVVSKL